MQQFAQSHTIWYLVELGLDCGSFEVRGQDVQHPFVIYFNVILSFEK